MCYMNHPPLLTGPLKGLWSERHAALGEKKKKDWDIEMKSIVFKLFA